MIILNNSSTPINCEFCNASATDMEAFISVNILGGNGGESCVACFTAFREWTHCDSVQCREMAEYNSKKGDEVGDVNTMKECDESAYFLFEGAADVTADVFDRMTKEIGLELHLRRIWQQEQRRLKQAGQGVIHCVLIIPPRYSSFPHLDK